MACNDLVIINKLVSNIWKEHIPSTFSNLSMHRNFAELLVMLFKVLMIVLDIENIAADYEIWFSRIGSCQVV